MLGGRHWRWPVQCVLALGAGAALVSVHVQAAGRGPGGAGRRAHHVVLEPLALDGGGCEQLFGRHEVRDVRRAGWPAWLALAERLGGTVARCDLHLHLRPWAGLGWAGPGQVRPRSGPAPTYPFSAEGFIRGERPPLEYPGHCRPALRCACRLPAGCRVVSSRPYSATLTGWDGARGLAAAGATFPGGSLRPTLPLSCQVHFSGSWAGQGRARQGGQLLSAPLQWCSSCVVLAG